MQTSNKGASKKANRIWQVYYRSLFPEPGEEVLGCVDDVKIELVFSKSKPISFCFQTAKILF